MIESHSFLFSRLDLTFATSSHDFAHFGSFLHGDPCNYRPISLTCIACKLMAAGI